MNRLFIGNFDFEHSLTPEAGNPRGAVPERIQRLQHELAAVWTAVADEGDFIWLPAKIEQTFFDELASSGLPGVIAVTDVAEINSPVEACPWGWTDEVRRQCERHGWLYAAPSQEVIREVNSRRFSFGLEKSWGVGLEGAAIVGSVDELATAVLRLPEGVDRWILKAEFGMSARERFLGHGREPDQQAVNWFQNRSRFGVAVVLEPWVDRIEEAGLQFTIPQSGVPLFEGVAPLLSTPSGGYVGNRFSRDVDAELRWMPAIETGMRIARALKGLGYFGPLGIDAMRYRDHDGRERIRSVQDINARHSMGRLALGLQRVLESGEFGSWLHVRQSPDDHESPRHRFEENQQKLPPGVRVIRTSPFEVGGRPVEHGTLAVTARSQAALEEAENIFLSGRAMPCSSQRTPSAAVSPPPAPPSP